MACNSPLCESFVEKVNSFSVLLRRTMEEDVDTVTQIIITKLPGTALFIQLCCTGCGTVKLTYHFISDFLI
jgi:hypothetical protein